MFGSTFQCRGRASILPLAALISSPALAWGDAGHRAIADIAWAQLNPRAIAEVTHLLALSSEVRTPACPLTNLEQASTWADCVRSRYHERYASMSSWHYVNVDICRPFDLPVDPVGRFLVRRLTIEIEILRDRARPPIDRLLALLWVLHLVGDIHQPLHVGDHADRGGNEQPVNVYRWGAARNLHAVWDRDLVAEAIATTPGGVAGLALDAERLAGDHRATRVAGWARQSWQLARQVAYGQALDCKRSAGNFDAGLGYARRSAAIVRLQLERAGTRLAATLNSSFGG